MVVIGHLEFALSVKKRLSARCALTWASETFSV